MVEWVWGVAEEGLDMGIFDQGGVQEGAEGRRRLERQLLGGGCDVWRGWGGGLLGGGARVAAFGGGGGG